MAGWDSGVLLLLGTSGLAAVSRGAGNGSRPDSGGAARLWDEVCRAGPVWVIVKLLCALGLGLPALKFTPKRHLLLLELRGSRWKQQKWLRDGTSPE